MRHIQSITIPDIKHFEQGAGNRKHVESLALQCPSGHSSHALSEYTINENCTSELCGWNMLNKAESWSQKRILVVFFMLQVIVL